MKTIFAALIALIAGGKAYAATPIAAEYVSIDCPAGDLTLDLKKDGTFHLELKHWDAGLNKHTESETFSGRWSFKANALVLSGKTAITYTRKPTAMTVGAFSASIDSLKWVKSSKPTFADRFTLIERRASNDLFLKAAPK